ncbi:MAG: hypothetical protein CVT89_08955, partial [Candidatus Altiarchaeales archaeon HGW-Altiarchaeales-2]
SDDIKKFIDNIDNTEKVNSFLIVGGDDVIPFFKLKNPAGDDGDEIVYSDNPYASKDNDYFIPERCLGRIPDGNNAEFLISILENFIGVKKDRRKGKFGYTAFEWIKASKEVYKAINGRTLKISPPVKSNNVETKWLNKKKFFYFNLHGSEETKYWYGQKGENYPVAFSPENLNDVNCNNAVIFSEACYGANIINKSASDAISLKFLERKAICVVASTKIAYGPSEPPSTDADLLGKLFFKNVINKESFGIALMKAKQNFVVESSKKGNKKDKGKSCEGKS